MATDKMKVKDYSDTFLYRKGNYSKALFDFMMHADFVSPTDPVIKDLVSDLNRQRSGAYLSKVLTSPNTHICVAGTAMPRAFKAFVAKDLRGSSKEKKVLYIDLTGILTKEGNTYKYRGADLGIITSYLLAGLNAMVYYKNPSKILNNNSLTESGCKCFSSLIYYLVDYMRLTSDPAAKSKVIYLSTKYYQLNILNKEYTDSIENRALKLADISEQKANMINMSIESVKDPYQDIDTFTKTLAAALRADKLTMDVLVDKWMYHIGVGTQFGLELYPAFANILLYAYIGAYLNHQKTIEKCVGRPMVDFATSIIAIGSEI